MFCLLYGLITFVEILNECFRGLFRCQKVLFYCLEKIKRRNLNFLMFYAFLIALLIKLLSQT